MPELRKILCVDDEPDVLFLIRRALEKVGGFEICAASSGQEALDVVDEAKPDAILLDVMMPQMDGPATLAALQSAGKAPGAPVIFMTARVRPSEIEGYLNVGASGVIAKPFDPMTLHQDVRAIWSRIHAA